jgi:hypothetical protein
MIEERRAAGWLRRVMDEAFPEGGPEADLRWQASVLAASICADLGGQPHDIEEAGVGAALLGLGRREVSDGFRRRLGRTVPGDLGAVLVNRGQMPVWAAYPLDSPRKGLARRSAEAAWRHLRSEEGQDPECDAAAQRMGSLIQPLQI